MRTFERSQQLYEEALHWTPGASQTGSKAPGRVGPLGAFPLFLQHAEGARVWDVDGHEYIDWFNGNAAVTLGHGAITPTAHGLPSLPSPLEADVARQLCAVIPCAEAVRFVRTGSEACAAAVRIARMATGKSVIVTPGTHYHGWHDWHAVLRDAHPGVPEYLRVGVEPFRYNDLDSLERALIARRGDVAAVMLEPMLTEWPHAEYLPAVVRIARQHKALVIFDEMICGGRWALAGGQQFFQVQPDLATFGKAYGNGTPIAFVCGRRDLMRHAWAVSGTYGGELAGLSVVAQVLPYYQRHEVVRRLWQAGDAVARHVNAEAKRLGVPLQMTGAACHLVPTWTHEDVSTCRALWQQELAQVGILAHPNGWNPSAAHTASIVQQTCGAVTRSLEVLAGYLQADAPLASHLRGRPLAPAFVRTS